jgi:RNA polymerase sigma-70 factor (ECF subfamily)
VLDWLQGNEKAFDELYYRYYPRLFRLCLKITKSATTSEEITHDVFMKIWKNKSKTDPERSFQAYVFVIAKNEICRHARRKARQPASSVLSANGSVLNDDRTEQDLFFTDYMRLYKSLLDALPSKKKQIFILHRHEKLSYREIADKMQLSVKTVEFHMHDCLQWFRKGLRLHTDLVLGVLAVFCLL